MKKVLYLILFFPAFLCAQLEFRGNTTFVDKQEKVYQTRYGDPQHSFPILVSGFSNELGTNDKGALEFIQDIGTNGPGNDRGGWYPATDMVVDGAGSNPFQPFGDNFGLPRRLYNIHFAANKAFAEKNKYYASLVLQELIYQSVNPRVDFSNQTVFDRSSRSFVNPVFMIPPKMNSYRLSYGAIYDLVKGSALYENNKVVLNDWFKEAADYFKAITDNNIAYWIVAGDWTSDSGLTARGSSLDGYYTHYDATGSNGQNEVSDMQFNLFNNRALQLVSYVGGFGMSFGDDLYTDWFFDYYKKTIQLGVFPDNDFHELARGASTYPGFNLPDPQEGVEYTWESLMSLVARAIEWEVLVEKGFEDERGRFIEYSTQLGTGDVLTAYTGYDSTSGGPKNLKGIFYNLSNYYNGTFQRYTESSVLIYPTEKTFSLPTAMINTYFQELALEDFYMFNTEKGYPPADKSDKAFAVSPSNYGIGIGQGAAHGGIVAYGKVYGSFDRLNPVSLEYISEINLISITSDAAIATNENFKPVAGGKAYNEFTGSGSATFEIPASAIEYYSKAEFVNKRDDDVTVSITGGITTGVAYDENINKVPLLVNSFTIPPLGFATMFKVRGTLTFEVYTEGSPDDTANLYIESSAVNAQNEDGTIGSWHGQSGLADTSHLTVSTDDPATSGSSTGSIRYLEPANSLYERAVYDYAGYEVGETYEITFYYRRLQGDLNMTMEATNRSSQTGETISSATSDTGWLQHTYTWIPSTGAGEIRIYGDFNDSAGVEEFLFTNFYIRRL